MSHDISLFFFSVLSISWFSHEQCALINFEIPATKKSFSMLLWLSKDKSNPTIINEKSIQQPPRCQRANIKTTVKWTRHSPLLVGISGVGVFEKSARTAAMKTSEAIQRAYRRGFFFFFSLYTCNVLFEPYKLFSASEGKTGRLASLRSDVPRL